MTNEDSHIPLIKAGYKSTTSTDYQQVIEYVLPPDKLARIYRLEFDSDTTGVASILCKLTIDGIVVFDDLHLTTTSPRVLEFGGGLKLRPAIETGIKFYVRSSDGTNVKTTVLLSGIEVQIK